MKKSCDLDLPPLHVNDTPECVTVMTMDAVGTCSASNMSDGRWYLNRLVVKEGHRGQGLGPRLLSKLKLTLAAGKDCKSLVVEPGGYGSDPERLWEFYRREGFEPNDGYLEWKPVARSTE